MASGLTTNAANRVIDATHGTTTLTAASTPVKIRLTTSAPTAAAAGTEVTGGSYAAQTLTMGAASAASAANSAALTYSSMPVATVVGVDEFDNAGTPFRWWFAQLAASRTTASGDTLTIAIGAYTSGITSP